MAIYYFKTGTGEPFTDKTDAGDDAVAKGHAIKVSDAPEGIESWRMSYNFGTSSVDVKYICSISCISTNSNFVSKCLCRWSEYRSSL